MLISKEQQGLEPRKPTKTTSFYHSIYCDSREGRTKSNVMFPKRSAQPTWDRADLQVGQWWERFFEMSCQHLVFCFWLSSTSFSWQVREIWNIHPQEHCAEETRSSPSRTFPPGAHQFTLTYEYSSWLSAPDPASRAEKGRVVLPDATPANIKHTFSFHHPTDARPINCTNVITFLTKLLHLFTSS